MDDPYVRSLASRPFPCRDDPALGDAIDEIHHWSSESTHPIEQRRVGAVPVPTPGFAHRRTPTVESTSSRHSWIRRSQLRSFQVSDHRNM